MRLLVSAEHEPNSKAYEEGEWIDHINSVLFIIIVEPRVKGKQGMQKQRS